MQLYDLIMSGILYVIGGVMLWLTSTLTAAESKIMPLFVAVALIVCATIMTIQSFRKKHGGNTYDFSGTGRAFVLGAITVAYVFLSERFGMYVCTPIYIFVAMLFLGQRKKSVLVLVPVVTTVCLYLMFQVMFSVPLPRGTVFDLLRYLNL